MDDAYVIGIRLALDNGVSAGVAAIGQELAALDTQIATTALNLQRLTEIAASATAAAAGDLARLARDPGRSPPQAQAAPDPILPAAQSSAILQATRAEPSAPAPAAVITAPPVPSIIIRTEPAAPAQPQQPAPSSPAPQSPPASRTAAPPASPVSPPLPQTVASVAAPAAPPSVVTVVAAVPQSPIPAVSAEAITAPSSLPVAPAAVTPAPSPPPIAPAATTSAPLPKPPPTVPAAVMGTPATPPVIRILQTAERPVSPAASSSPAPSASSTSPLLPLPLPPLPSPPSQVAPPQSRFAPSPPDRTAAVAPPTEPHPAAPRAARSGPGDTAARRDPTAPGPLQTFPSVAPQSASPAATPVGGDVFLDGARVGTWITNHLAREASRPPTGTTGFDPRMSITWPGAQQGG